MLKPTTKLKAVSYQDSTEHIQDLNMMSVMRSTFRKPFNTFGIIMSHWDSSCIGHTHRDESHQDQLKARLHLARVQWAPPILGMDPSRDEVDYGLYLLPAA